MSSFAAALPEGQRAAYLAAVTAAGALLRTAVDHLNDTVRAGGPRAAAQEAHRGGKSTDEIEAQVRALMSPAREQQAA